MLTCEVIKYFGTKAKVAQALGMNRCSISLWGEQVPLLTAYRIERLTKGKLKAKDPWFKNRAA